jgi:hypothetical protein
MRKRRKKNKDMNLDQQIQACENRISQLEQIKRTMVTKSDDLQAEGNNNTSEKDINRINADLDEHYHHYTLLKIRKMMGF